MDEDEELRQLIAIAAQWFAQELGSVFLPELQAQRAVLEAINAKLDDLIEDEEEDPHALPLYDLGGKLIR